MELGPPRFLFLLPRPPGIGDIIFMVRIYILYRVAEWIKMRLKCRQDKAQIAYIHICEGLKIGEHSR